MKLYIPGILQSQKERRRLKEKKELVFEHVYRNESKKATLQQIGKEVLQKLFALQN
ncbi:10424_t:CDS:1, partial [Gigaspora margarita]